jgi:hypothetical protein
MKKVLSVLVMVVFVAGLTFAQTTPAKKAEKKEAKTEMKTEKKVVKADTTKTVGVHKTHTAKKK